MSRNFCFAASVSCFLASSVCLLGQAHIDSFSPMYGSVGDQVLITGSGFSTGVITVRFWNNKIASATPTSDTIIYATVPSGAVDGPLSVQVNSGAQTYSSQNFTVIGPGPYISDFSPTNGAATTRVYLNGAHFTGATSVKFNNISTASFFVVAADGSYMWADAPSGVTTGPITVTNPQGSGTSTQLFYVAPLISGFSPVSGRAGTNVVIRGNNLTGATAVKFNNLNAASFTVNSLTQITATVSANVTTGPIRVDAPAGSFITSSNFVVLPTVSGFTPAFGAVNTSVTVTGANFYGVTSVKFNGQASLSVSGVTYSQLTATVPSGATSGPISVTTTNGTHTSAANFYLPAGITSFSPNNSAPGSRITITGVNFTNASAVAFNGTPAAGFTVTNNTTIGATVPGGVITGPISVTTPAGTATSAGRFYGAPVISGFSPTHGAPLTSVTISGVNFLDASAVRFNGLNAASFSVGNNNSISAQVPNGAQTGPITVVAPAGSFTTSTNFVVDYTSDLAVTMSDSPDPVILTSNLVYTIQVGNNGPNNATNLKLTNTLPPSVVLKSATTTQGTLTTNSNPIVGNLGTLNAGNFATVTLTVAPQVTGAITNTVRLGSDNIDPAPANNSASVVTTVLPLPRLTILLSAPDRVRISWPVALTNFLLQFKNVLGTNSWSNVVTSPAIIGGERVVIETNTEPARFYRLRN